MKHSRNRPIRTGLLTFAASAAVVGVTACSATAVHESEGTTLMAAGGPATAAMEALIVGTLTITEGGCIALRTDADTYPLQFPHGTRLSDDGTSVMVPGLDPLELGEAIRGGGGFVELADVPAACESQNEHGQYAVWQTLAD
jgi:hypothetical protein